MGAHVALGKIICFHCRRTNCAGDCASGRSRVGLPTNLRRAVAWLGGACVAGTALGAMLALLFGG